MDGPQNILCFNAFAPVLLGHGLFAFMVFMQHIAFRSVVAIQPCMVKDESIRLFVLIRIMRAQVAKIVLIGVLAVLVVCMVPIMGTSAHAAGHLHHDASASCATCMGTVSVAMVAFSLPLLFILIWLLPIAPPLRLCRNRFHPPCAFDLL